MALQHYLPATYLACFSTDTDPERRQRVLSVGDKKEGRVFSAPASKVCGINNFYTLFDRPDNPNLVDSAWSFYENGLASALDQLISGTITCQTWASTLVPFVTGLLVRGPDFNERFEDRFAHFGIAQLASRDNTNMARLFENQRLSASVLGAKWVVLRVRGNTSLISSDLGYAPFVNPTTQDLGIAIPISLEHILVIAPKLRRKIAVGFDGTWWPIIEYEELLGNNHLGFNQTIASYSQRFIFGPDSVAVNQYLNIHSNPPQIPEPVELGFMGGHLAMVHEMTWFRLLTAVSNPPTHDGAIIYVDYVKNANRI